MNQNYRSLKILASVFLFLLTSVAIAQTQTVRGKVTASNGESMPGVNVVKKGTTEGTATDANGEFTLAVNSTDVLVFTFIGYTPQEISVGNKTTVDVTLVEDVSTLDEVIVVGYGEVKKSDLTGAVASVSAEQLKHSMVANIDQALQGRVAGVQVTQNSGQPGGAVSIRIRGASSITGSSEPLYVIDGIPFQGDGAEVAGFDWAGGANGQKKVNALSTINPSDIVSLEVLKDASATAIYGSRAANGVVLITTKRGKSGETKISYNGYYGVQSLRKKIDMMNLREFADYQLQISEDLDIIPNQHYLDPSLLGEGTDWQSEIFQAAPMQSHQLSFTGGTDKSTFAISGGYFSQDGIVIGSGFDRFTVRANLDNQVKDWMKVGLNLSYANTSEKITLNDGGDGVIMQALLMQPDVPVKDLDGNYAGPSNTLGVNYNPVAQALLRNNTLDRNRIMSNFYADATIIKGLTFRSEIGFDANRSLNKSFHPTFEWGALVNTENKFRQRTEESFFWIWKNYLTYNKTFGNHNLTAMAGYEAQRSDYEGSTVTKYDFATNDIPVLSQGTNNLKQTTDGWKGASSLQSYFGRVNYTLLDRYLFTFTMRADGSSKFGPDNRWGYFPSGSVAWRAINESFLEGITETVSDLKVRFGYGEVGNQAIPDYLYGSSLVTLNSGFGTAYRSEKFQNSKLKWETTTQYNLGLDLSLFNGKYNLTLDFYEKNTRDMLLQVSLPNYLGGSDWPNIASPYANIGKLQNRGIEIALNTRNFTGNKFTWTSDLNFTINRNEVIELESPTAFRAGKLYWYSEFQTASMSRAGDALGVFYGYVADGIFENEQQILDHAVQVVDETSITSEDPTGVNKVDKRDGVWIGDIRFKDLNGDGVINTEDQKVIGNPNPDFTFGINNSFTYGPFDLIVYLTGSYGAEILNYSRVITEGMTGLYSNQASTVHNRARYTLLDPAGSDTDPSNVVLANPGTSMPRFATNDINRNNRMSTRFIEDGSYIRIQNISLGYTVPSALSKKIKINRARVYGNIQNAFVFTNYSGMDPELGALDQKPTLQNVDMGRYPSPRVFTLGVDLEF